MDEDFFLSMQLEAGLRELDQAVFHGANEAAAETAKERAKARYMTLIAAAGAPRSC